MKYNNETSMEPHLQEEIQECLRQAIAYWGRGKSNPIAMARLGGIATAIHALTGEIWNCEYGAEGYIFINEDRTECICVEL